ncbi:MAG: uracil-DNA glycosylase [Lentisphaeria bacterium]|nr:uracil-DNA glycosylase [Lentisphaeria bacterium]
MPEWESLRTECAACMKCRLGATRTNMVFADGNPHAELMFIGEGPGADEDATGVPFVGRAGELLSRMIAAMTFDRKTETCIANIVKCRPPGNRNPADDEAAACMPYLKRQIAMVNPKVIVLLGAVPLLYLFNLKGIMRLRGHWLDYNGIPVMPTYHPAFLLRNPPAKKDAWADLQAVMAVFGRKPAPRH